MLGFCTWSGIGIGNAATSTLLRSSLRNRIYVLTLTLLQSQESMSFLLAWHPTVYPAITNCRGDI